MPAEPQPGDNVDGFILGARVHAGAQGSLFRVTKPGLDRPLVMKLPRIGPDQPSESVVGFETEATIVPTLRGPHVPPFVAAGDLARAPYLVTAWIEGATLDEQLARGPSAPGRCDPDRRRPRGCAPQPAPAGRDPPGPEAVERDSPGRRHRRSSSTSASRTTRGTPTCSRRRRVSAPARRLTSRRSSCSEPDRIGAAILFALGVVLYEMATGKLPFGQPDTDVRNRFWLDPPPPATLVPAIPPWMQEIILRCLEPRAEHRYQSAAHVAFDLRHPEQVALTPRATKAGRAGLLSHVQRFLRARAELGPRLRSPGPLLSRTPIVLVAVNTRDIDDQRHPAIHFAMSQMLALSSEFRLICLTVIPPSDPPLEHLVRLRQWTAPLGLPIQRLSLHAVPSDDPAEVIVELARHNNADLVVLGAPSEGGRAWSQSIASTVTAKARCSVHVVRVPKR